MARRTEPPRFHRMLADFLEVHLKVHRKASPDTVRAYRQSIGQFAAWCRDERGVRFDELGFGDLSRDAVWAFLSWLRDARGLAPATLNLRLAALKSFLRYCGEEDVELAGLYLSVASIRPFRGTGPRGVEYLTADQLRALFAEPDAGTRLGRRDRFAMVIAYEGGLRMRELLDLTCGSVSRDGGRATLTVRGKGGRVRFVPISSRAAPHLSAYMAEFHPSHSADDWLLYTVHGGRHTQMSPGTVDHMLKKYAAAIHARDPSFPEGLHAHVLRHSMATAMYRQGVPISYIRDFLGHVSVDTTMVYAHADGEAIARALESTAPVAGAPAVGEERRWKGRERYLLELCGLA